VLWMDAVAYRLLPSFIPRFLSRRDRLWQSPRLVPRGQALPIEGCRAIWDRDRLAVRARVDHKHENRRVSARFEVACFLYPTSSGHFTRTRVPSVFVGATVHLINRSVRKMVACWGQTELTQWKDCSLGLAA
jgi:hypothetical protein